MAAVTPSTPATPATPVTPVAPVAAPVLPSISSIQAAQTQAAQVSAQATGAPAPVSSISQGGGNSAPVASGSYYDPSSGQNVSVDDDGSSDDSDDGSGDDSDNSGVTGADPGTDTATASTVAAAQAAAPAPSMSLIPSSSPVLNAMRVNTAAVAAQTAAGTMQTLDNTVGTGTLADSSTFPWGTILLAAAAFGGVWYYGRKQKR